MEAAADHVEAHPLPYANWLVWLVDPADRADRRFDGITLSIERADLEACATPDPATASTATAIPPSH